jgi:hypothetical protein
MPLAETSEQLKAELKRGSRIELVVGADRRVVRGEVVDVSASSLVVATPTGPTAFPLADVHEIWQGRRGNFRKSLLAGSVLGVGLGILAKAGEGDCNDPKSLCATDGPVTAADFGSVVAGGAALGSLLWFLKDRRLVFFPTVSSADETPRAEPGAALLPPDPRWLGLATLLEPGGSLTINQGKGLWWQGSLEEMTPTSIVLLVEGRRYTIPRESVHKIWRGQPTSWSEAMLPGLLIGGLTALGAAALSCLGDDESVGACTDRRGPALMIGGVGIWTAIIAVAINQENRKNLVYDSSRSQSSSRTVVKPLLGRGVIGVRGSVSF